MKRWNRDLNQLLCSTDGEPSSWTARAKIALDSAGVWLKLEIHQSLPLLLLQVETHDWLEDPVITWIDGEVSGIKRERIKVLCTSGKMIVVKTPSIYHEDAKVPLCEMDDRTKLAYLHKPESLKDATWNPTMLRNLPLEQQQELAADLTPKLNWKHQPQILCGYSSFNIKKSL